ncbi:MAG TPA: hypothetical protein VKA00_08630 [Trueperaceae bacterium]|nr:hypothetical protein [Trueperaceae bacterium]
MKRSLSAVCLLVWLLVGAASAEATLTVNAPPDRLALPGDFVTLVFRVSGDVTGQATIDVASAKEYTLLTPPGTIAIRAGVPVSEPVTVAIPRNAPALTVEEVTMTVSIGGAQADATTRVTVGAKRGLQLAAPAKVPLSEGSITFTLINRGNVEENVTLKVRHENEPLVTKALTLVAAKTVRVAVPIVKDGSYEASLEADGAVQARAFVHVVQEGVPAPPPIALHGELVGTLDTSLAWSFGVRLRGPLSDYLDTTAVVLTDQPAESYWTLNTVRWSATVGSLAHGPLKLPLPDEPGVRASLRAGPLFLGLAATAAGANQFSAYAFGGQSITDETVAAAAGMHAGEPMAAVKIANKRGSTTWTTSASLLDRTLAAQAEVSEWNRTLSASNSLGIQANDLLASDGTVHVGVAHSDPLASLWGSVDVPVGRQSVWGGRLGVSAQVPSTAPGRVYLTMQGGTDQSYATLSYAVELGSGWHTSDRFGATSDTNGFGVRVASSWAYATGRRHSATVLADVTYHPGSGITTGQLSGRYATAVGPASVSLTGGWNLTNTTADLGLAAAWDTGRAEFQAIADGGVDLASRALTASLGLSARWDFDLDVPAAVISAAGGRRLGTLTGSVVAGTVGIPNVSVRVGGYILRTGADGTFSVRLKPGRWNVSVELGSLPIEYRIDGSLERSVTLGAQRTTHVDFRAVATAGITGRVLLDSNGDGVADDPPRPGSGTVLLTDQSGVSQSLSVGSDGTFLARGLLPGPATLTLADLPLGATVEGGRRQTLALDSGTATRVIFLEVPAIVSAPTFSSASLRIRKIHSEVDRVPPGAAPIVEVTVQGHPDYVDLRVGKVSLRLSQAEQMWRGRIPVPADASSGVLAFEVTATSGERTAARQGQLIVDPAAPMVVTTVPPKSAAGKPFDIQLSVYADAASVVIKTRLGPSVSATQLAPSRWVASVTTPAKTKPGVYTASYDVTTKEGRSVRGTFQFRIGPL